MGGLIAFLAGPIGRWLLIALLMVSAAGAAALKMHQHDRIAYDDLADKFSRFRGGVEAAGRAQEKASAAKKAADEQTTKEVNDAYHRTIAALNDRIAGLRLANRAGDPGGGLVSPATADADGSGLACYDRAEFVGAAGALAAGLRRIADQGTAAVTDLNAAKDWALRLQLTQVLKDPP